MSKIKKDRHSWSMADNQLVFDVFLTTEVDLNAAKALEIAMNGPSWQSIVMKMRNFKHQLGNAALPEGSADSILVVQRYLKELADASK